MPYIKPELRGPIDECVDEVIHHVNGPGDLNYCISRTILELIFRDGSNYSSFSKYLAVLHDVDHELRRRFMDPYEDKKMKENGDIL